MSGAPDNMKIVFLIHSLTTADSLPLNSYIKAWVLAEKTLHFQFKCLTPPWQGSNAHELSGVEAVNRWVHNAIQLSLNNCYCVRFLVFSTMENAGVAAQRRYSMTNMELPHLRAAGRGLESIGQTLFIR